MIDGMLESAEETHHSLQQARAGSLDDYTVGRVREVYTTQRDDLWLYEEQLARWRNGELTSTQKQEVERLQGQLTRLRRIVTEILARTEKPKELTIETLLSKSDAETGLDFLLGKHEL